MVRSTLSLLPAAGLLSLVSIHGFAQAASSENDTDAALASYEQLVADLEARPNTFGVDAELSEAYYGLANSLQTLERHEEAVAIFDKALQALRENKGLYDVEQLPVLQSQLDSRQALASWQDVDAGRHLAHLITVKSTAAGTEQRYQTLRELGLWKLRAAEEKLLPNPLDGVKEAVALYRHELEQPGIRAAYEGRALSLANLYLDLAALEFLQAKEKLALPITEYVQGGPRTVTETQCQTIQAPDGRGRQVCRSMQVPNMDYFMGLSDRKYDQIHDHLDAMQDAVLEAYAVLLGEVETPNRDATVPLLSEVHRLTGAFNDFVAENARRTGTRIAPPTGSILRR